MEYSIFYDLQFTYLNRRAPSMKGSSLNVAALVRVSMEELGLDADTGEAVVAHTPELVEDSNEAIDAVVEAHGEVVTHHDTIEVMEDLVEQLESAVKELEGTQGTVSTENESVNGDIVNSITEGAGTVAEGVAAATVVDTVVTGGGEVTPAEAGIAVNPDVDGIVTDPTTIEPTEIEKVAEKAVSLERFRQNCARISSVYRSVGLEGLPALPAPEKKNAIIEGAKSKAKAIGAALKKMWDQFVAGLKSLWERFFNAAEHTAKRAAAVKSASASIPKQYTLLTTEISAPFEERDAITALKAANKFLKDDLQAALNAGEPVAAPAALPAAGKVKVYAGINQIAVLVESLCILVKSTDKTIGEFDTAAKAQFAKVDGADAAAKETAKKELTAMRAKLKAISAHKVYALKLAKVTLAAAEKSLRSHVAVKPAETATA